MRTDNRKHEMISLRAGAIIIFAAAYLAGCGQPEKQTAPTSTFEIIVVQDADCDLSVINPPSACVGGQTGELCVGKGDSIYWKKQNPSDPDFTVYFDPFTGTKYPTKQGGKSENQTKTSQVNPNKADLLAYKYSIKSEDGCELDPALRVDH